MLYLKRQFILRLLNKLFKALPCDLRYPFGWDAPHHFNLICQHALLVDGTSFVSFHNSSVLLLLQLLVSARDCISAVPQQGTRARPSILVIILHTCQKIDWWGISVVSDCFIDRDWHIVRRRSCLIVVQQLFRFRFLLLRHLCLDHDLVGMVQDWLFSLFLGCVLLL